MSQATSTIVLKSPREVELMRAAGRLVFEALNEIETNIRPGVTTAELNEIAERRIAAAGAKALFLGVENPQARFPFPASICSSVALVWCCSFHSAIDMPYTAWMASSLESSAPYSSAAASSHLYRQLRQKPDRFIKSMFCTSVRVRR